MVFIEQLSEEHLASQPLHIEGTGREESYIFVPLVLRDNSLGVLSIQHPQPYRYNQEDLLIINLLANHISLALHNIRLYSSLDQLNETGQTLTQLFESEKALDATAAQTPGGNQGRDCCSLPLQSRISDFLGSPHIAGKLLDLTVQLCLLAALTIFPH